MRETGTARGAQHDHLQPPGQRRLGVQRGGRAQQHVGPLQRLEPADEQQREGIGPQPETRTCGCRRTGREHVEVDTGRDGADPARVGAVERDEFGRLVGGGRDQPVGLGDHLFLADDAGLRLRVVTVGEQQVLHLRQGVGGVDEWHPPPLAGQPADLAGEPVVGVDEVVPARLVADLGAHDAGGEGTQLRGQVFLGEAFERTRGDVSDVYAGRQCYEGWLVAGRGPGEDLHLDIALGQPARRLDHVDVHSARVSAAGRVERRGVDAEHRHSAQRVARRVHPAFPSRDAVAAEWSTPPCRISCPTGACSQPVLIGIRRVPGAAGHCHRLGLPEFNGPAARSLNW